MSRSYLLRSTANSFSNCARLPGSLRAASRILFILPKFVRISGVRPDSQHNSGTVVKSVHCFTINEICGYGSKRQWILPNGTSSLMSFPSSPRRFTRSWSRDSHMRNGCLRAVGFTLYIWKTDKFCLQSTMNAAHPITTDQHPKHKNTKTAQPFLWREIHKSRKRFLQRACIHVVTVLLVKRPLLNWIEGGDAVWVASSSEVCNHKKKTFEPWKFLATMLPLGCSWRIIFSSLTTKPRFLPIKVRQNFTSAISSHS